jgi:hypothetical protein
LNAAPLREAATTLINLAGLISAPEPLAIEELAEIHKRKQRRLAKLPGKKPLLQVVK